jgi:hypothetical protein
MTLEPKTTKLVVIVAVVIAAFLGAYGFASAQRGAARTAAAPAAAQVAATPGASAQVQPGTGPDGGPAVAPDPGTPAAAQAPGGAQGGGSGCSCCGGGAQAPASASAPTAAKVADGVQRIAVDVSKGYYDPGAIVLKAGVPAEITFSKSSGCTAVVESKALGFREDLTGGPRTVKLPALQPGEYGFNCGMQMVFGKIVVK